MTTVTASVAERLSKNGVDSGTAQLVVAAFAGEGAIDDLLATGVLPEDIADDEVREPLGAYVTKLAVEGFRESVMNSAYPSVLLDLAKGPVVTQVDLVHCHEVVEREGGVYFEHDVCHQPAIAGDVLASGDRTLEH